MLHIMFLSMTGIRASEKFEGKFFSGKGDVLYLNLLDICRRMFSPDAEFQSMPMLYAPDWNGFHEGIKWNRWWLQNAYGTTYCALPFYTEPYVSFLENSHDMWFDNMGDGKREFIVDHRWFAGIIRWTPPDGCLMDCASPGYVMHKQGDGKVDFHDWGVEFTAAGLLMQAELLLISRDLESIEHYLPRLERCAGFIESRRDPKNNLFLAGAAGNLLAPSYAGWKKPDGTYDKAYLAGLSVTFIAALDRLIELERLAGNTEKAQYYSGLRDNARKGLPLVTTDEGYFIMSLDPDGTKHGVYGAEKHGYFESSVNHDAIAFRVADDAQANKIYDKIASIPALRFYDVILANYPSYDDMYVPATGAFEFGRWVNGGNWSTCEARMILGYFRLGKFDDARRSMVHMLKFAESFRMDNPVANFGNGVNFPEDPIHLCYDNFGPPAAMIRGLFEYLYGAEGVKLVPHIPPTITELEQHFPIRFGDKRLYLSTAGAGPITSVVVNGQTWKTYDASSIFLPHDETPNIAHIRIVLGGAELPGEPFIEQEAGLPPEPSRGTIPKEMSPLRPFILQFREFYTALAKEGLESSYEAAHVRLAIEFFGAACERKDLLAKGKIRKMMEPAQYAADELYLNTAMSISFGIEKLINSYEKSDSQEKRKIYQIWHNVIKLE